ncbi:MAG TPA: hypothetical protein DHW64_10180 [Chitinophagaceae bacterium]|nr:hypothetical protein [Chitinophagaceae bacterium]
MNNCLNCNLPLSAGQNFCPNCGQKAALKRLNLHDIWHDVVHYFTHADKGIFQLLKALVTETGTVAREFVSGKRKKYFPPLNFFLIVAALYVFMGSVIPNKSVRPSKQNVVNAYQKEPIPKESASGYSAAATRQANVGRFFNKYANFVAMFAAPYISLIIWLILLRGPYNFTEHLVANLYLIGFTNLVRCMLWTPLLALLHVDPTIKWPIYAFAVFEILYRAIFYYRFMGKFNTTGKMQALGLAVLSVIAWWVLISAIIFVYMMI